MDICCELITDGQNKCGSLAVFLAHVYVIYSGHVIIMAVCNIHKDFLDDLARTKNVLVIELNPNEYWIQKIMQS